MADERLSLFERRTGEALYGLVDRRQPVSRIMEVIDKAREFARSQPSIEPYMVEASVRRMIDTPGGLLGYTPSILAAESGQDKTLRCLLENNANPLAVDGVGTTMLHAAASASQLACVALLVSKVNIDQRDSRGDSALHWACSRGDMKVVEKLVENNANVNLANNSGATPIYNACYNGHYEVVDHLIQKGASLSTQNNNGDTPLHIAVSFSQLSIVDSLIKSGARTTIKNNDGKVAIDMTESETVRAAVNDVLPKASVNGSDARGGGGGTGVDMPVWKPPVSLPAASLSTPAMKAMVAKFKATLATHEAIEPKTLLRSLQGSLDKLSWWKFENQFEGADASSAAPPSQRVVTSDDLVPLCAYLRFSSQCGVDIRPTSLEIRIEEHQDSGMRAFFLLPMQSSLVKPAPGEKLIFRANTAEDAIEATANAEMSLFASTIAVEKPTRRGEARRAAIDALRRVEDADVCAPSGEHDASLDEAAFLLMDLSQSVRESTCVCVLQKQFDEKTRLWRVMEKTEQSAATSSIPGFSSSGAPKLFCKGGMTSKGDSDDSLREKGVLVIS